MHKDLGLAVACAHMLLVVAVTPAMAVDDDRALASFARPPPASARGPAIDALGWERRLRAPGVPAPKALRSIDQALLVAARSGSDERVRELLQQRADPNVVHEDGFTALGAAAWAGRRTAVRLLLRAGADAARQGATGQTALHLAALAGQLEIIDEMLRAQVDVELLNRQRETALDIAAAAGQQAVMARLLDASANLDRAGAR